MSALPYMPLYVSDYLADAAHLTTEEHGAYLLLIMNYWQRGKPLPADPERLARIARMSNERWTDVERTLNEFFEVDGECWRHHRIDAELDKVREKSDKAKQAGIASARSKKATNVQRTLNERSTDVEQTFNHTDTDTDTDIEEEREKKDRAPLARDPKHWEEVQDFLRDRSDDLTDWEVDFLNSVKWKRTLSAAQQETLSGLRDKLRASTNGGPALPSVKRGTPAYDAWIAYYRKRGPSTFYEKLDALTVPTEFPPETQAA